MRGGAREGAGRKTGWRKEVSEARPSHNILAHQDEWELIRRFSHYVKHGDRAACEAFLDKQEAKAE